jgi:hypothetical protein
LIITPNRIPMMNVVTDSTEVRVVRSRPFATFEPYGFHLPGIRGLYERVEQHNFSCRNRVPSTNLEDLLRLGPSMPCPLPPLECSLQQFPQ